jgi:hypothetical protein
MGGITMAGDPLFQYCYATGNISASSGSGSVQAAGIAVPFTDSHRVKYCVALNEHITVTSGGAKAVYRVFGGGNGDDNYANADMIATGASFGTGTSNNGDGGDVSLGAGTGQANNRSWWQTSGTGPDWTIENQEDATNASPWVWDSVRRLPKLYWE